MHSSAPTPLDSTNGSLLLSRGQNLSDKLVVFQKGTSVPKRNNTKRTLDDASTSTPNQRPLQRFGNLTVFVKAPISTIEKAQSEISGFNIFLLASFREKILRNAAIRTWGRWVIGFATPRLPLCNVLQI